MLPADGENRAPTATDDTYTVIAGGDIQLLDVLNNDSDPDGDPLSIADVDSGSEAVAIDPSGAISFEPPLALAGAGTTETVSFAYEVADGRGGTDRALVTVQIVESDVPIAPIAVDDIAGPFSRGQGVAVNVLANDSDPDGRVADLTITSDDPLLPIAADGTLNVAAADDTIRLGYTITDVDGLTATAEVTVIILDNVAPVVAPLAAETEFQTAIDLPLASQATDADNDELTFACCEGIRGGHGRRAREQHRRDERALHPRPRLRRHRQLLVPGR